VLAVKSCFVSALAPKFALALTPRKIILLRAVLLIF
jgi:hypothetical protein